MDTFVLLTVTGLALGAMYFLIASGLSLIYGLMGVLNFATAPSSRSGPMRPGGASKLDAIGSIRCASSSPAIGLLCGAILGALVEVVDPPALPAHIEQALVTVGLSFALIALVQGIWGPTERIYPTPKWMYETTRSSARRSRTTASSRSPPPS